MENDVEVAEWTLAELVEHKGMPQPVAEATIGNDGVLLGFEGYIDDRYAGAFDTNIPFGSAQDAWTWLKKVRFCGDFPSLLNLKTGAGMTITEDGTWVDDTFGSFLKAGTKLGFPLQNDGFGCAAMTK